MESHFKKFEKLVMDELANIFEQQGMSPLLGRICGLLLFCDKPLSLQQVAEGLEISRAAASINIRNLVRLGLVNKLPPGVDRRDYYLISKGFAENLLNSSLSNIGRMIFAVDECIKNLPHPSVLDSEKAARYKEMAKRLEDFQDVLDIFQHSLESTHERIRARREARKIRRV